MGKYNQIFKFVTPVEVKDEFEEYIGIDEYCKKVWSAYKYYGFIPRNLLFLKFLDFIKELKNEI